MNYSWNAKNPDIKKAESLSSELQISPFLSKLLVNRDISSHEEAYEFLHPYVEKDDGSLNLPNPFLLKVSLIDGINLMLFIIYLIRILLI